MCREQFTFYRSYYEAIKELPKREQTAVVLSICEYALDEVEPTLSGTALAVFRLIRPTLDAGRRKAENRTGKKKEQADNKQKTELEQTRNEGEKEKEREKEKEKEREGENECSPPPVPPLTQFGPELQDAFDLWQRYKRERRESYKPTGLQNLISEIQNNAVAHGEAAVAQVIRDSMASGYKGIMFDRLKRQGPRQTGSSNVFAELLAEGAFDD